MATDEDFAISHKGQSLALPVSGIVTTVERIPIEAAHPIEAPTVPLKWSAELLKSDTIRVEHGSILTLIWWSVQRIEE